MNKFKFSKRPSQNNEYDKSTVEISFEAETVPEILQELENFLKACGFCIDNIEHVKNNSLD